MLTTTLPLEPFVEDIDEGSFAALGALAQPSGVEVTGDTLRAEPAAGTPLDALVGQVDAVVGRKILPSPRITGGAGNQ